MDSQTLTFYTNSGINMTELTTEFYERYFLKLLVKLLHRVKKKDELLAAHTQQLHTSNPE